MASSPRVDDPQHGNRTFDLCNLGEMWLFQKGRIPFSTLAFPRMESSGDISVRTLQSSVELDAVKSLTRIIHRHRFRKPSVVAIGIESEFA